jgi:hypothetical protein
LNFELKKKNCGQGEDLRMRSEAIVMLILFYPTMQRSLLSSGAAAVRNGRKGWVLICINQGKTYFTVKGPSGCLP